MLEGDPRLERARLSGELAPDRVAKLTLATVMELAAGLEAPGPSARACSDAPLGTDEGTDRGAGAGGLGADTPSGAQAPAAASEGDRAAGAPLADAASGEASATAVASPLFDAFCRLLRLALYAPAAAPHVDAHAAEPFVRTELEEKSGS